MIAGKIQRIARQILGANVVSGCYIQVPFPDQIQIQAELEKVIFLPGTSFLFFRISVIKFLNFVEPEVPLFQQISDF